MSISDKSRYKLSRERRSYAEQPHVAALTSSNGGGDSELGQEIDGIGSDLLHAAFFGVVGSDKLEDLRDLANAREDTLTAEWAAGLFRNVARLRPEALPSG